ncbi:MAG: hypothetical protein Q7U06_00435 [Pseudomonadota bacterium]|nr:hypothetical protein [Pseudomonadota bacterium]
MFDDDDEVEPFLQVSPAREDQDEDDSPDGWPDPSDPDFEDETPFGTGD